MFYKGQLVWVRIGQYPLWPAKITKVNIQKEGIPRVYKVSFLGEHSRAAIIETDIFQFDPTRPQFTPDVKILKKYKRLQTALAQASKIYYVGKNVKIQGLPKHQNQQKQKFDAVIKQEGLAEQPQMKFLGKEEQGYNSDVIQINDTNTIVTIPIYQNAVSTSTLVEVIEIKQSQENVQNQLQCILQQNINQKQNENHQGEVILDEKSCKKWQFNIFSEFFEQFCVQKHDSAQNLILEETEDVSPQFFKNMLPQKPKVTYSLHKKIKLANKQKQRSQYSNQLIHKSFVDSITHFPETKNQQQQKLERQIQYKLQCILFLLYDSSQINVPLKQKMKQLRSIFDLRRIDAKVLMNTKISAMLSFIFQELDAQFLEEKQWIKTTIKQTNCKILQQVNNFSLYKNYKTFTRSFTCSKSDQSLNDQNSKLEHQRLDLYSIKNIYKPKIKRLIEEKVPGIAEQILENTTSQIIDYLLVNKQDIYKKWKNFQERARNFNFEGLDGLVKNLKSLLTTN